VGRSTDQQKVDISKKACEGKLGLIRDAVCIYRASSVLPFPSHFALWHPSHRHLAALMSRNQLFGCDGDLRGHRDRRHLIYSRATGGMRAGDLLI
jgi:hypothetical protein